MSWRSLCRSWRSDSCHGRGKEEQRGMWECVWVSRATRTEVKDTEKGSTDIRGQEPRLGMAAMTSSKVFVRRGEGAGERGQER